MFFPLADISYLVSYTTTGDHVMVEKGLEYAILVQLMVAADLILMPDVQRAIHPKD